ncbi:MAG: hypothetical protein IKR40_13205 [Treponema sp.]|nr:hypothetical protein [Treponema sp.]
MNKKRGQKLLVLLFNTLLIFGLISCTPDSQVSAKQYSSSFSVSGYYICYDGIHYRYRCGSVNDVKGIISYYYPDCFDVIVYNPGTEQTGYLNTIFYATWKSYLDYVQIQ